MADPEDAAATTKAAEAVAAEEYLDQMLEERHKLWVTAAIGKVRSAIAALEAKATGGFSAEQQGILDNLVKVLEDEESSVPTPAKDPPGFVSEFRF